MDKSRSTEADKRTNDDSEGTLLGKKNAYICKECNRFIVTVDVDDGVTPFMIKCRAKPDCPGTMYSRCYQIDQTLRPTFEWYAPDKEEIERLKADGQGQVVRDHIKRGGLMIRPISRLGNSPQF